MCHLRDEGRGPARKDPARGPPVSRAWPLPGSGHSRYAAPRVRSGSGFPHGRGTMIRLGGRAGSLVSLGLALGMWCVAAPAQTTWPMYQGDASHSGALPIAIDPAKISLKWDKLLPGLQAINPVTAADGKVFATQASYFGDSSLYALDKETGDILWSHSFGSPFSVNPPGYDN